MTRISALLALLLTAMTALAISPEEVDAAIEASKAAPRNRALAREAGDALKQAGRYGEAIAFYQKSDNAGNLGAAEAAFYLYDFERAQEFLDRYLAKRTKAEADKDMSFHFRTDGEPSDWAEYLGDRISMARSMLDRVEQVEIIDSVSVDAEDFFKAIRLAASAGRVVGDETVRSVVSDAMLDSLGLSDIAGTAYVSESGEDLVWAAGDTDGNTTLYESMRLADGSWDHPRELFGYQSIFGSEEGTVVSAPFLMADGVTLYFAADGNESLGGLDIFISRRDGEKFLQPSNLGMPFNSPFNDYLYAIDEETGTGWWVTDRNSAPGKVTVYTFVPSEMRVNYPPDTPRLADFARVADYKSTAGDTDRSDLLRRIRNLDYSRAAASADEFAFALPDGRVLRRMSDLGSPLARAAMKEYLEAGRKVDELEAKLSALRKQYGRGDHSHAEEIIALEDRLETMRAGLTELSNRVVSTLE